MTFLNLGGKNEGERKERKWKQCEQIAGTGIGNEGAKVICEMLKVNIALTFLLIWGKEERKGKEKRLTQ